MDARDEEDWAEALDGDPVAFAALFDRHHHRIRRHSLRLTPTHSDADDIVAIVFLEAWRHRHSVRFVDGSLLPWLLVTANNTARNLARSSRRYHAALARLPATDSYTDPSPPGEGQAETALRLLPLSDQQVITLCVIEGLSESEASTVLSIPRGTVKSRLSRAKRRLALRVTTERDSSPAERMAR